jgi:hypothetical protein
VGQALAIAEDRFFKSLGRSRNPFPVTGSAEGSLINLTEQKLIDALDQL